MGGWSCRHPREPDISGSMARSWLSWAAWPSRSARYVNATVQLSTRRVLNPDGMMLAKGSLRPPRLPRPSEVKLVVEVADRSIAYDEGAKLRLYAEAEVGELWIVRVPHGDMRVLRRPVDGLYLDERIVRPGDVVTPLFAPDRRIDLAALFEI